MKPMKKALEDSTSCSIIGEPHDTGLRSDRPGTISVRGLVEGFRINPSDIATLRPDLFKEGHFSAFDALVHACNQHDVPIEYHFHEELLTHVIDSIDGRGNWWYGACYHGCWSCEEPAHRMDTYPCKDWTRIEVYRVSQQRIQELHSAFRAEVERLESNHHKVIVPEVSIQSRRWRRRFADVEVKAHGLREDLFQPGEMTAADIMLSLAERGDISLETVWRDRIGSALVQAYYFTRFDDEEARGRAGFTYDLGEKALAKRGPGRFGNNHFHMTSDIRVIVSPQYMHWRWTDLSRRERGG